MKSLHGVERSGLESLHGRDCLTVEDFHADELKALIQLAEQLKHQQLSILEGKTLGLLFDYPSTRSKIALEVAMLQLGGQVVHLKRDELQLSRGEELSDTARVLSSYLDGLVIRTYSQVWVEQLALHASIPVINGLTEKAYPCQSLADLLTIYERKGSWSNVNCAFIGDGESNVLHSFLEAASMVGMNVALATPPAYKPDPDFWSRMCGKGRYSGSTFTLHEDPTEAVKDVDVVYTDVCYSMVQEGEKEQRLQVFEPYQVTEKLMNLAKNNAIFMHSAPVYRGQEVSANVIDGPRSVVFAQAENHLHAMKALLFALL